MLCDEYVRPASHPPPPQKKKPTIPCLAIIIILNYENKKAEFRVNFTWTLRKKVVLSETLSSHITPHTQTCQLHLHIVTCE